MAENTLSRAPKAPPSKPSTKPLKGQKAQIVVEKDPKVDEWEKRYEKLKCSVLKKFKV